jgi:hypothetical protein
MSICGAVERNDEATRWSPVWIWPFVIMASVTTRDFELPSVSVDKPRGGPMFRVCGQTRANR